MSNQSLPFAASSAGAGVAVLASVLLVLAIDVRFIFFCLDDLNQRHIVTVFDRQTWTMVIILGGPLGEAAYLLYGQGPY